MNRETRFWAKVDRKGPDDCWLWTAAAFSNGYGAFRDGQKQRRAHRVAWEIANGPLPEGALVCHSCDTPRCVNPTHLWLGSHADNHADRGQKGRTASGDRNGTHTRPDRVARGDRNGARVRIERMPRGSRNGNSKLTEDNVRSIRELYATGNYSSPELGRQFGVVHSVIQSIVRRDTWKHLD